MKYKRKPVVVVIEAFEYDGSEQSAINISSIKGFEGMLDFRSSNFDGLYINTLEGQMHVSPGDYVIIGIKGEFYPCKPDIFNLTYDKI